jgi:hypothetical protein
MSVFAPSRELPSPRRLTVWAAQVLRSDTDVRALLAAETDAEAERRVMEHRQTLKTGSGSALPGRHLVVREVQQAGGRVETLSGTDEFRLQVMSECAERLEKSRTEGNGQGGVDRWHEDVQRSVRAALVGEVPDVGVGGALLPIRRRRAPQRPQYDPDDQAFYATSVFTVPVAPADFDTMAPTS